MPQEAKSKTVTSSSTGPRGLQGTRVDASDPDQLRKAIELAFDYRGDVTIVRRSDPAPIEGYIFDRRETGENGVIRLIPSTGNPRVTIPYNDIAALTFTGRDTAAGKSFETWMRKYVQKKLAGEDASIHAEPLDGLESEQ